MNKKFYLEALLKYKNIYFRQAQWDIASYLRGLEHTWFLENKTWDENAVKFQEEDGILIAKVQKDFNAGDTFEYKIKPSDTWRPWSMIFNAEIYSREASNAKYELKSDTNELTVYFDPKISYVWFEESEVN